MGAAVGVTPTMPFHTIIVLALSYVLRLNPIAAILAATIVSNPFTIVLHYYAAWWIGTLFFPDRLSWKQVEALLIHLKKHGIVDNIHHFYDIGLSTISIMMTGGAILALIVGSLFYFCSLRFFIALDRKKREKHHLHHKT